MAENQSRLAGRRQRCGSHMLCGAVDPHLSSGKVLESPTCTGEKCLDKESAAMEPCPGSCVLRGPMRLRDNGAVTAKIPHVWKFTLPELCDPKTWGHHGARKVGIPQGELWAGEATSLFLPGHWPENQGEVCNLCFFFIFKNILCKSLTKVHILHKVKENNSIHQCFFNLKFYCS